MTDLDRTLTGRDLALAPAALDRIAALRAAGARVVVATGRPFDAGVVASLLMRVDGMVAENGAVVCVPHERSLEIFHAGFAEGARAALGELAARFQWGRVIGSGPRELGELARERLAAEGVASAVEYNAEECMLLPANVSKATGAQLCLRRLGMSATDAWAIGDGENDVALLEWAALGAAPANAARAAKDAADVLMAAEYAEAFLHFTEPLLVREPPPAQ